MKPVFRKPRSQWVIPAMREDPKRVEPAGLKAFIAGTSPLAREILRKLFFGLEQRLTVHQEPLEQVVPWLEDRLKTFWALRPEFTLLLSRLWGGEQKAWLQLDPRSLAILLVLGGALELKRSRSAIAAHAREP